MQFYLWSGVGPIEDLEGVDSVVAARKALTAKAGDGASWTLWVRKNGEPRAALVAVLTPTGEVSMGSEFVGHGAVLTTFRKK